MRFHAIVGANELIFGSNLVETHFYEQKGKPIIIELDDRPTAEMRRFFEDAVVPYIFYQSDAAWSDFRECREALKLEFLPAWTLDLAGNRVKVARSTTELSKAGFRRFLDAVMAWMEAQGMELPDSEEFKRWRDSGPLKGEVYPPLERIMERRGKVNGRST